MKKSIRLLDKICEEMNVSYIKFEYSEKTEKELLNGLTESQKLLYDVIISTFNYNQKERDRAVVKYVLDYISLMCSTELPWYFD